MSSTSGSTIDQSNQRSWGHCGSGCGSRGNWSGINIAAMVLGFVVFWPVGLVILYWIFSGRNVQELPGAIRHKWSQTFGKGDKSEAAYLGGRSDNSVFNDFQQTQYDRIREIKEEIKERSRRFKEFRVDAQRRADQDEFNRFMSSMPGSGDGQAS